MEDHEGEPVSTRSGRPWTRERVARLAFLAGQGFTAKAIAADPLVRTTYRNVYRQAARFGIAIASTTSGEVRIRLPAAVMVALERTGAIGGMTRDACARSLVIRALAA